MAKGKYAKWLEPDNLILLEAWARDGLTDEQIAHNIGISISTLNDWKNKFSEFSESLKKGKEVADIEVENALKKSAEGFYVEETVEELRWNRDLGKYEMVLVRKNKKYIQPSTAAQIFWLKNRRPDVWKDKREIDSNAEALEKLDEIMERIGGVE